MTDGKESSMNEPNLVGKVQNKSIKTEPTDKKYLQKDQNWKPIKIRMKRNIKTVSKDEAIFSNLNFHQKAKKEQLEESMETGDRTRCEPEKLCIQDYHVT